MIRRIGRALVRAAAGAFSWAVDRVSPKTDALPLNVESVRSNLEKVTDISDAGGAWYLSVASEQSAWWIHDLTGDAMVVSLDERRRRQKWRVHYTPEESREPGHIITPESTCLTACEIPSTAVVFARDFMQYGRPE